jgi:hypothetical protein
MFTAEAFPYAAQYIKEKVQFTLEKAMKVKWGGRGIALLFL